MHTTAPYRRVASAIRQDIINGVLRVGDALQSRPQLARKHGVSQATVAKALDRLKAQGVLESRQGVGVFVAAVPESLRFEPVDIHAVAVFECSGCWGLVRRSRLSDHSRWHHELGD